MLRTVALFLMGVAAAVIAAGGVILASAAWHSTSIEWQRPYISAFVVALAAWEALAVTAAIVLWKNGFKPLAPFALAMLVAASMFTARYDILNQLQSQSDRIASRTATVDRSKNDAQQLAALTQQQAVWTARIENARGRELTRTREEIDGIRAQINSIMARMNDRPAVLEAAPDAAFAARFSHYGSEADWIDFLSVMMILALPLGRILLTPIAIAFWQIAWTRKEVAPAQAVSEVKEIAAPEPEKPALAQEKKIYPAVEAMKASALALKGNAIDAAVAAVKARKGDDALSMEEIFGELAVIHEARGLPQPGVGHSKAIGKRMEALGYEKAGRQPTYKPKKRGRSAHKVSVAA